MNEASDKVEIYLGCRRLKRRGIGRHIDPQVRVYRQEKNDWKLIGSTEIIKGTVDPNYSKTVETDFVFETQQYLFFEVIDVSLYPSYEVVGSVQTTLGKVLGAHSQVLVLDIHNKEQHNSGKIIIQGERSGKSQCEITWQWSGIKLMNTDGFFDKSDPFLRFLKIREADYLQVHETEVIMDNLNPNWQSFKIKDYKLCGADHNKPFKIECWDWEQDKNYQYIGSCELTIQDLKNGRRDFELHNPKKKKSTGTLRVNNFHLKDQVSFIDYIKGGQRLKLMIAIDFTGSNKVPTDPNSLHSVNPQKGFNQYQQAINSVCQVLQNYDSDQMYPVYGFGGIPHFPTLNMNHASHCFVCTGDPSQPGVLGIDGVMNAYYHALQHVELSGPTYFSPLMGEVMKYCKVQKDSPNGLYTVLLILTDGEIHDMEQTINCLIDSSHLPLSIIIVGIGDEDFSKMVILDGDNGLFNSKGIKAKRDLVQFVHFNKMKGDMQKFAKEVLEELPDQLVEYMTLIGKKPNPPGAFDMNNFGYSLSSASFDNLDEDLSQPHPYISSGSRGDSLGNIGSPNHTSNIIPVGSNNFSNASTTQAHPMPRDYQPGIARYPSLSSGQIIPNYQSQAPNESQNQLQNNILKETQTIHRYDISSIADFVKPNQNNINSNLNAFSDNRGNQYMNEDQFQRREPSSHG